MECMINLAKAFSDSSRIRALFALKKGELCVCRIIEVLGLAPSTVSRHMTVLKHARLVKCRKEEKWIYYSLTDSSENNLTTRRALDWLFNSLSEDKKIIEDSKYLDKILRHSPETIRKNAVKTSNYKNREVAR